MSQQLSQEINKELRHLGANHRSKLAEILDVAGAWKKLASILPKPDNNTGPLFSSAAIYQLERQLLAGKSPTIELINSWSTSGRRRPTVKTLLIYLDKAQMQRAKDYVCRHILDLEPIDEPVQQNIGRLVEPISCSHGSRYKILSSSVKSNTSSFDMIMDEELHSESNLTASIDSESLISCISRSEIQDDSNDYLQTKPEYSSSSVNGGKFDIEEIFTFDGFSDFQKQIGSKCQRFSFESIYQSTKMFCHKPYNFSTQNGTMLGEGRYIYAPFLLLSFQRLK